MPVFQFVIVRLCVFLILGILTAHFTSISFELVLPVLGGLLILFFILWKRAHQKLFQDHSFALICYIMFFWIGITTYTIHQPQNIKDHYLSKHSQKSETKSPILQIKIKEVLKPTLYNNKYIGNITTVDGESTSGKVLINTPKDSTFLNLNVDDVMLITSKLIPFTAPRNPHQFDYGAYMKRLGVYRQLWVQHFEILKHKHEATSIQGIASKLRHHLQYKLKKHGFNNDTYAIINALLLGQRQDISKETYENYAAAGAIHILAVSGLHVGIVMLIIHFLLRPLERFPHGKAIKLILTIALLWCFAIVTGLSPSVVRAAMMFSFLAAGLQLKRHTNPFNTLFCSAFILLLINPNFLFQVGFQLSYMAVIGILLFYPIFSKIYDPKTWIQKKLWDVLTVSITAQLGVLPLSLLYFNQFAGLFFVTNLVILPFLGGILGIGLLVLLLAAFDLLPFLLAKGYSYLIDLLNSFIAWIAEQSTFVIDGISFSLPQAFICYVFFFCLATLLYQYSYKKLCLTLVSVLLFQGTLFYHKMTTNNLETYVFHSGRNTTIGVKQGKLVTYYSTVDTTLLPQRSFVDAYLINERATIDDIKPLPDVLKINQKLIVVIDSLSVYPNTNKKPDVVLLSQSPRIHLERVIDSLQPQLLIADGSNYTSFVNRWEATSKKRKHPFYHTTKEGAFQLKYK